MNKFQKTIARWFSIPTITGSVRVDITCPHGAFIHANYQLGRRGAEGATLSCDRCAMKVKLSWGQKAAMLNRRDDLLADHPEITTTAELGPLMGDLEPAYWDWVLGRVAAGEVPASEVSR